MSRIKYIVVNLEGEIGLSRRQSIFKEFQEHNKEIELFPAVNGSKIMIIDTPLQHIKILQYHLSNTTLTTLYDATKRLNGQRMTRGELGNSWSHQLLYRRLILDDSYDAYLIFDDDVRFINPNFDQYLSHLPDLNTFDICTFAKDIMWYPLQFTEAINPYYTHIFKQFFNNSSSFIVTKRGASRLLNFSQCQCNIPADDLLSNSFINGHTTVIAPKEPMFKVAEDVESAIEQIEHRG